MQEMDFYDTIFKRKSIRKFDLTPLNDIVMENILRQINDLNPLYSEIKLELKILGSDDVKTRIMKKAPHYLAVFSQIKGGYLTNVGFMLQQMDLFFSANGIGSCWQAIPQPTKEVLEGSDLEFIILMPFGKPAEPIHRESISQFKRKPLQKITNNSGAYKLIEAAGLAPSGASEPWYFTGNNNIIHAYSIKPNFITGLLIKKYIPIDLGIAIYHLKVAAEHFGHKPEIVFNKPKENFKNHEYVASLKLN